MRLSTKAQQQTAVGQGLAVGCLSLGYEELPSHKMNVELAFRRAWRTWPHAGLFPMVKAGFQRDDIMYILHHSDRRREPIIAFWEIGRTLRPTLAGDYELDEAKELLVDFYDMQPGEWEYLAQTFAEDLMKGRSAAGPDVRGHAAESQT